MTKLKMKKLKEASLLLAVMVVLTACGNKENAVKGMDDLKTEIGGSSAETGEDSTGQGAGNNKGESGETSQGSSQGSAQDNAQGNVGIPVMVVTELSDHRYTDDEKLLVQGDFQGAEVTGEGYEAVAEAVQSYFAEKEQAFRESVDIYEESALAELQFSPDFPGYASSVESSGTRVDSSIISIKSFHYDSTGGAHPNYGTVGATFDAKTGFRLSFWDLAADKDAFAETTLNSCLEQVTAEYGEGLYIDYEETIRKVWEEEPNWYLDEVGVNIIFTPYEIGPYAMGEVTVLLPYEEFSGLLKPEYQMAQ